jgi:hypothetical protein
MSDPRKPASERELLHTVAGTAAGTDAAQCVLIAFCVAVAKTLRVPQAAEVALDFDLQAQRVLDLLIATSIPEPQLKAARDLRAALMGPLNKTLHEAAHGGRLLDQGHEPTGGSDA